MNIFLISSGLTIVKGRDTFQQSDGQSSGALAVGECGIAGRRQAKLVASVTGLPVGIYRKLRYEQERLPSVK